MDVKYSVDNVSVLIKKCDKVVLKCDCELDFMEFVDIICEKYLYGVYRDGFLVLLTKNVIRKLCSIFHTRELVCQFLELLGNIEYVTTQTGQLVSLLESLIKIVFSIYLFHLLSPIHT